VGMEHGSLLNRPFSGSLYYKPTSFSILQLSIQITRCSRKFL